MGQGSQFLDSFGVGWLNVAGFEGMGISTICSRLCTGISKLIQA